MKNTGIARKIDNMGRIVIPKEIRDNFGFDDNTPLAVIVDSSRKRVILEKYEPGCMFCGEMEGLVEFDSKKICKHCAEKLFDKFDEDELDDFTI